MTEWGRWRRRLRQRHRCATTTLEDKRVREMGGQSRRTATQSSVLSPQSSPSPTIARDSFKYTAMATSALVPASQSPLPVSGRLASRQRRAARWPPARSRWPTTSYPWNQSNSDGALSDGHRLWSDHSPIWRSPVSYRCATVLLPTAQRNCSDSEHDRSEYDQCAKDRDERSKSQNQQPKQ